MNDGWVKLHRKILDNPLFADVPPEWLRIAMFILLKANHEPKKWYDGKENVSIPAGSFVTSSVKIAEGCRVGRTVVRNAIKYLDNSGFVTSKTTNRYMLLTITNWKAYQDKQPASDQVNDQQATSEQPASDQQATSEQPQLKNVRTIRKKECKKESTLGGSSDSASPSQETGPARIQGVPPERQAIESMIQVVAKNLHSRHVNRKCALRVVVAKLRTTLAGKPAKEHLAVLAEIDAGHKEWCASTEWTRENGSYQKGLEPFLNSQKERWNDPAPNFQPSDGRESIVDRRLRALREST